mgnify:CR=1 FL=1
MKNARLKSVVRIKGNAHSEPGGRQQVEIEFNSDPALLGSGQWPQRQEQAAYRIAAARARSDRFRQVWGLAVQRLRSWRERRRAISTLERLSDRALADFGISRGEIHRLRSGDWSVADFNTEREVLRARLAAGRARRKAGVEPGRTQPLATESLPAYDHAA